MEETQPPTPQKNKKGLMIGVIIIVVIVVIGIVGAVIWGIIYFYNESQKSPEERAYEELSEIIEEQANQSEEEQINEEERIATIESLVKGVFEGNNLDGVPYLKSTMVVRRITEEEEYAADVEYWADDYPWADISLKESDIIEYKAIMVKCAELFKAMYAEDQKVGYTRCRAFLDNDAYNPVFSALIEDEQEAQVDWSQDTETLAYDVLPSIWKVWPNDYWIYDDDL